MTTTDLKRRSDSVTGVRNSAYDLLSMLEHKLRGIATMEQYKLDFKEDGDMEAQRLLEEIEQQEIQQIGKLREIVKQRL